MEDGDANGEVESKSRCYRAYIWVLHVLGTACSNLVPYKEATYMSCVMSSEELRTVPSLMVFYQEVSFDIVK